MQRRLFYFTVESSIDIIEQEEQSEKKLRLLETYKHRNVIIVTFLYVFWFVQGVLSKPFDQLKTNRKVAYTIKTSADYR